jgi:hypothetical protein
MFRPRSLLVAALILSLACSTPQQKQTWKDVGKATLALALVGTLVWLAYEADKECRDSGKYCGSSTSTTNYPTPTSETTVNKIHTEPGTCSWHEGIINAGRCVNGMAYCADDQPSPGGQRCYCDYGYYCEGPLYEDYHPY